MKSAFVPVCYHPTTVLFVDDNRNYLTHLSTELDVNKFIFSLSFDPLKALDFLSKYKPSPFINRCLVKPEDDFVDHSYIDIEVTQIYKEIYNTDRFAEISVVVVDYAMPNMTGLDFCAECRLLKDSNFKLLLLTGEADEGIAVRAFNDRIIDKFIRKDSPDFKKVLNAAICELQMEYFNDLSQMIVHSLIKDPYKSVITWLDEPGFLKIFDEIIKKNNCSEYYLADAYGSYLFLDLHGKPSWLIVKDEEVMYSVYEMARDSDTPYPDELLNSIKEFKQVLYLHKERGITDELELVKKSIHPATKLTGNKANYYYSYVEDPDAYDIQIGKVVSYADYQKKLFPD